MIALMSITCALFYIIYTDFGQMINPSIDKSLEWFNFRGVPYFFGTALFMFEGNAIALEIYH